MPLCFPSGLVMYAHLNIHTFELWLHCCYFQDTLLFSCTSDGRTVYLRNLFPFSCGFIHTYIPLVVHIHIHVYKYVNLRYIWYTLESERQLNTYIRTFVMYIYIEINWFSQLEPLVWFFLSHYVLYSDSQLSMWGTQRRPAEPTAPERTRKTNSGCLRKYRNAVWHTNMVVTV